MPSLGTTGGGVGSSPHGKRQAGGDKDAGGDGDDIRQDGSLVAICLPANRPANHSTLVGPYLAKALKSVNPWSGVSIGLDAHVVQDPRMFRHGFFYRCSATVELCRGQSIHLQARKDGD